MFFSACNCAYAQYVVPVHEATLIPVAQLCQHTLSATCTVQAYLVSFTIGLFLAVVFFGSVFKRLAAVATLGS